LSSATTVGVVVARPDARETFDFNSRLGAVGSAALPRKRRDSETAKTVGKALVILRERFRSEDSGITESRSPANARDIIAVVGA
jgi:hypothetical protein